MYQYQRFWDRIANSYANNPIKNQHAFNNMIGNIRKYVNENDFVLDFGCGTGTYSIAIADKIKSLHGIDISNKMLAIATERASSHGINNIHFEQMEIFDTKLQPGTFNVVLAFNILHLQHDMDIVLDRINELLVPGGLLIAKTVCTGRKFSVVTFLLTPFIKLGLLPHFNCFTFSELQQTIGQHQFNILETGEKVNSSVEYFIVAQRNHCN